MFNRLAIIGLPLFLLFPSTSWCGITGVVKNNDLAFGSFISPASSGTITVSATGARSSTGGINLRTGGTVAAASFTMTGSSNSSYTITLPANNSVTINHGGQTLTLTNFTCSLPLSGARLGGGVTSMTFTVGADAIIVPNAPSGSYSGTFNITIN